MAARASSARSRGTETVTRRRVAQRNADAEPARRSRRPTRSCGRARSARTPRAAGAARPSGARGTATLTSTRWSPRPRPWSTGMPLPAQDANLARLRSGLELELDVAVEGLDLDRRAEGRLRHRQVDRRDDVVALPNEPRVGPHVHHARRRRRPGRRAAPAWPSPLIRIRWPSWIPRGISTSSVALCRRAARSRSSPRTASRPISPAPAAAAGRPACERPGRRRSSTPTAGARARRRPSTSQATYRAPHRFPPHVGASSRRPGTGPCASRPRPRR